MKTKKLYKWIITVSLFFVSILIVHAQASTDFIEKVQQYQNSVKLIHYSSGESIDSTTFNLNQYLNQFCKLRKDTDLAFNIKYFDTFLEGRPYLYVGKKKFDLDKYLFLEAVKATAYSGSTGIFIKEGIRIKLPKLIPGSKNPEYASTHNDTIIADKKLYKRFTFDKLYNFLNDSIYRACNHLAPEDSEEGYLQYLFFNVMGEQFALKWHALYDEKSIITSKKQLKQFVKDYSRNSEMFSTDSNELKEILKINPIPLTRLDSENYTITWYELETHNGLYERTYKINRFAPYLVKQLKVKKLVTIEMNFLY